MRSFPIIVFFSVLLSCRTNNGGEYRDFVESFFRAAAANDTVFLARHIGDEQPQQWLASARERESAILLAASKSLQPRWQSEESDSVVLVEFLLQHNGKDESLGMRLLQRDTTLLVLRIQLTDRL